MNPQSNIVVCEDGFKFKLVTPAEGLKLFQENTKEVFILDDNDDEYLVTEESQFNTNHRFAIEYYE